MCVCTFLEDYDFSGKKIFPVCTNEGSGMGSSVKDLNRLCKDATIDAGLSIHGAEASESDDVIKKYLRKTFFVQSKVKNDGKFPRRFDFTFYSR